MHSSIAQHTSSASGSNSSGNCNAILRKKPRDDTFVLELELLVCDLFDHCFLDLCHPFTFVQENSVLINLTGLWFQDKYYRFHNNVEVVHCLFCCRIMITIHSRTCNFYCYCCFGVRVKLLHHSWYDFRHRNEDSAFMLRSSCWAFTIYFVFLVFSWLFSSIVC